MVGCLLAGARALTFVLGFAILRLLRLKIEMAEAIVFAAGPSIAFLMR